MTNESNKNLPVYLPSHLSGYKGNDFLPNLCESQSLFLLVLVAELIALLICISSSGLPNLDWDEFAMVSVVAQWNTLLGAYALCRLRPKLAQMTRVRAGSLSIGVILLINLFLSVFGQLIYIFVAGLITTDLEFDFNYWQILNNLLITAISAGILLRYLFLQQQLRNQREAEMQARVQALQSRIRPHFLFNCMNSIASLIESAPQTAERVVEDLSELFRASLAEPTLISLERELELCRRYLAIEALRLGKRLQVDWQITEHFSQTLIPSLMLQPLIENAILHGIEPLPEGGKISIKISQKDKLLSIVIINPYRLAKKNHDADSTHRHNRMALENIRSRLKAHYGDAARLSSSAEQGQFTTYIFCPVTGEH
jgi:two-component system, LytTR family, sensor histidine kinase AlgZ